MVNDSHWPFGVPQEMYYVTLTHADPKHRKVESHTYAHTYGGAMRRMQETMDSCPEIWDGWTFWVHPKDGELDCD